MINISKPSCALSDTMVLVHPQGYRQRGTYIATQVPMENTVNDFWKMIWEYKSKTIVVLCKMAEDGEVDPIPNLFNTTSQ